MGTHLTLKRYEREPGARTSGRLIARRPSIFEIQRLESKGSLSGLKSARRAGLCKLLTLFERNVRSWCRAIESMLEVGCIRIDEMNRAVRDDVRADGGPVDQIG